MRWTVIQLSLIVCSQKNYCADSEVILLTRNSESKQAISYYYFVCCTYNLFVSLYSNPDPLSPSLSPPFLSFKSMSMIWAKKQAHVNKRHKELCDGVV